MSCSKALSFAIALFVAPLVRAAEPLDRVVDRALELTGPSFQSCGEISITSPEGEECFLDAYERRRPAIGTFSVRGSKIAAASAHVITKDGALVTITASSDKPELIEHRCAEPFIAVEFTNKRVRCKEKYDPPLGAAILKEPPVWLTSKEEHPELLEGPMPASACPASSGKVIVQLLVDSAGRVPEARILRLAPGCSASEISTVLKTWRYSPPKKNGKPINTVEIIELSYP